MQVDVHEVKDPAGRHGEFPLTPMQEGMLFHYLSEPGSGVDLEQIVGSLHHPVDVPRLRAAWERAARVIPRLGASFRWVGVPHPVQQEGVATPPLEVRDLSAFSPDEREARVAAFLEEDRARPFRLDASPLLRLTLFRLGEEEYRLVWTFPHIVMDGRSFPIVLREVFRHYDGTTGAEDRAAPRTTAAPESPSYADFVRWYGQRDTRGEEAFWKGYLGDYPGPTSVLAGGPSSAGPERTSGGSEGGAPSRGPRRETSVRLSLQETDRLRALAEAAGVSLNTVIQGAWGLLLSRHSGEEDVAFGAVRACRRWGTGDAREMVGMFINTLPVRTRVVESRELKAWLAELSRDQRSFRPHEHTALIRLQQWSGVPQGTPLFESLLIYDHAHLDTTLKEEGGPWERRDFELLERTTYPLTLYGYGETSLLLKLAHDLDRLPAGAADRLLGHLAHLLREMGARPECRLEELETLPSDQRRRLLHEWNDTAREIPLRSTLHGMVADGLEGDPTRIAVACGEAELSAGGLEELSNRMARHLRARGVANGDLVGVALPRSVDMVVALLGVLKAGAAYLPLDPEYPAERLSFMVEDSGMKAVIATRETVAALGVPAGSAGADGDQPGVHVVLVDRDRDAILATSGEAPPELPVEPEARAYVIYTSGSTGRPKGVQVEHRNVVNFLVGMDDVLSGGPEEGAWLSLTSFSFDISILEIFWTLSRGRTLILHRDEAPGKGGLPSPFLLGETPARNPAMEFSLFYFASDSGQDPEHRYRLLLEGARFADREGFSAVWTPERHFHAFGGLYPNPAVVGAAVAAITSNVGIRAGSVVLPLHHPVRVAEEWSVVDNLSGGRVGVSVAAGWHPDDFLLAPENHAERKDVMFRNIDVVQRLWRGERLSFPGPEGREVEVGIMPRPIQQELPIWVTTAGNLDTYREAGSRGLRVLTHLLGQTVEELGEKIAAYREAWDEAGHPAGGGHVSLMLHTFAGNDDASVREVVREPMKDYLRTSVGLIRNFASAWTAYRRKSGKAPVAQGDEFAHLSDEDMDALLEFSFDRYFESSGLFGSRETCLRMARRLRASGVSEIACLIDFGVETDRVLEHLPILADIRRELSREGETSTPEPSFASSIRDGGVTHIQCTPSQLRILLADPESREALRGIPLFLVGGEAFPGSLARELREATGGRVLNMYGPTETTIWSSCLEVTEEEAPEDGVVPIGRPIANTRLYVLDRALRPVPVGVAGELFIGGLGVARGYLDRPELNRERFLPDPFGGEGFGGEDGARMYRTGDRVRQREDGVLEFLGRTDHQVKLRGHRIETGEIEAALQSHPAVAHAAVVLREDAPGDQRLAAYLVPGREAPGEDALVAEVKDHLAGVLPAIMVPSSFTLLEELPLTPNRKVDRKALPAPSRAPVRKAQGVETSPSATGAAGDRPGVRGNGHAGPPDPRIAGKVSEIWKDLLGLEEVGLDDNFFDLGGHSLLTVQVHGRIREAFRQELRITDFFRYPTIRTLSHFLAREGEEEETPEPVTSALDRGALRRQALRLRTRGGSEG
jgi:natural product biosynthesis luciferase-like monooxygenase protein